MACKSPRKTSVKPAPDAKVQQCLLKPKASCANADLALRDLRGLDLRYGDFHGAKFVGTDLTDANLENTNLAEADFSSARLIRTKLMGANLQKANLPDTKAEGADFRVTNLRGAIIGAKFDHADFTYADLVGAKEYGCQGETACCQKEYLAGEDVRCPDGTIDTGPPESWVRCRGHIYQDGHVQSRNRPNRTARPDGGQPACAGIDLRSVTRGPKRPPPDIKPSF